MENSCPYYGMSEYFKRNIGRMMKIECYINKKNQIITGRLFEVGDNFVVLKRKQPLTTIICETSSIKFATIMHEQKYNRL